MNPPNLNILTATDHYLAVNKPAGLLSVPGRGRTKQDSIQSRVRAQFPAASGPITVHRLDMETSGVILVALNADTHRNLSKQFEARNVEKHYIALLRGVPDPPKGEINLPIRLDPDNRPRQVVDFDQGKPASTRYETLEIIEDPPLPGPAPLARVAFFPLTGRSHQLRVHAASPKRIGEHPGGLGCPIAGDSLYGVEDDPAPRMMLHAEMLTFADPDSGEVIRVRSATPF